MLLFILLPTTMYLNSAGFNTSHVTLYHGRFLYEGKGMVFQYISCYSLSKKHNPVQDPNEMFQYISCYSLSSAKVRIPCGIRVSIHLMLLFIGSISQERSEYMSFQYISCYSLSSPRSGCLTV